MNDLLSWRDYFPQRSDTPQRFQHVRSWNQLWTGARNQRLGRSRASSFFGRIVEKKTRRKNDTDRDNVGIGERGKNRSVFTRLPFLLERRMISLNLNPVVIDAKRIISASSPPFSTNLRNPIPLTIQQRSRSNQFEA